MSYQFDREDPPPEPKKITWKWVITFLLGTCDAVLFLILIAQNGGMN